MDQREQPDIEGATVTDVRELTEEELEALFWDDEENHVAPTAIELNTGAVIVASRNYEMNGPGHAVILQDGEVFDAQ